LLQEQGLSQRQACRLLDVHRASVQYQACPNTDALLVAQMQQVAQKHPRWGSRKVYQTLRRHQTLNHKRLHRLWKQTGLQVKARRRRKYKPPATTPRRVEAQRPGQVWSLDFVFDATEGGTKLKMLTVGDDFTRQCLLIAVGTSFSARRLQQELARLVQGYGLPEALRMDNGPEMTAQEVQTWLSAQGIVAAYIQKGSPWQNGFRESFHSRLRDELLSASLFVNVADARTQTEAFRRAYNGERPHQALGGLTPDEYHQAWLQEQSRANGD
jgi:transposase InsO family protein